jgi:hypothetical protein
MSRPNGGEFCEFCPRDGGPCFMCDDPPARETLPEPGGERWWQEAVGVVLAVIVTAAIVLYLCR